MKIIVKKDPIVIAKINKIAFENELKKSFDLKKAVMDNLTIEKNEADYDDVKLCDYIYLATDWGDLFKKYDLISEDYIDLKLYSCRVEGFTTYKPDQINTKTGAFNMNEEVVSREDFMIVTAFNSRIDKHIEYMLAQGLIDYGNFEWKVLLEL